MHKTGGYLKECALAKFTETYSQRISKQNGILLLSVYDQLQYQVEDYIRTRVKDQTTMKQKNE